MSKESKFLDTNKLVIYSELLNGMLGSCDELGMQAVRATQIGSISEKEKTEIHNALMIKMKPIDDARIKCANEIEKRMKNDLGISHGPQYLSKWLSEEWGKYPTIKFGEAEWKFYQGEQGKKQAATETMEKANVKPKGKVRHLTAKK